MSNKQEPLLKSEVDEAIELMVRHGNWKPSFLENRRSLAQDISRAIKAARAKDAELIQQLVDALKAEGVELAAAASAGFKPSEQ